MKTSAMKLQLSERGCVKDQPHSEASASEQSIVPFALSPELAALDDSLRHQLWRCELALFGALLVALNLPLFAGEFSTRFIYHPIPVAAGEWWRLLTHPFVHVSPYHLALDAAAFFLAYAELRHRQFSSRLLLFASAAAGSLLAAIAVSPLIAAHGLCGLSGVAHGLTAVVSLESARRSDDRLCRWGGWICFAGMVGKSIWEAVTSGVLFVSWHLGPLGTPIAECHAGGVLGALLVWLLLERKRSAAVSKPAWETQIKLLDDAHIINTPCPGGSSSLLPSSRHSPLFSGRYAIIPRQQMGFNHGRLQRLRRGSSAGFRTGRRETAPRRAARGSP